MTYGSSGGDAELAVSTEVFSLEGGIPCQEM